MVIKIDHIGIAVENLQKSISLYQILLGKTPDHLEEVLDEKVKTAFFQTGESHIELLQALSADSPIAKFIAKKGRGGLHHICIEVDDIRAKLKELKNAGVKLIDTEPKTGAYGRLVAFVHPQDMGGVLIELAQIKN